MPAPRALVPALVACSVLAVYGTLSGIFGLLLWNEPPAEPRPIFPLLGPPPDTSPDAWARIEDLWNRQMPAAELEAFQRHRAAINALAVVNLVASATLMVGTQLARRRAPGGLAALRTGLGLSEAYASIALAVDVIVRRETLAVLRPALEDLDRIAGLPAQLADALRASQLVSGAALQLAFYAWMHWYVGRPHVAAALKPEP